MNIVEELKSLRRREFESTVDIVEALVTCGGERAYLEYGCSSIWDFLVNVLEYPKASALRRMRCWTCTCHVGAAVTGSRPFVTVSRC